MSGNWINHPHTGTATATITSLTAATSYQVHVLAVNSDGDGPYSSPGAGTTGTPTTSSDATLSALALEDASDDSAIAISPTFASGTTSYTASVVNGVDEITIDPTVNESNATVQYLNSSDTEIADANSGKTGQQVSLSEGANTIKVKVTAQDATTNTYTVVVTRAAANNAAMGAPTITGTAQVGPDADGDTLTTGKARTRRRADQRHLHVPVDSVTGERHGGRHCEREFKHLHPGRRRPGQDHQGQGELRIRDDDHHHAETLTSAATATVTTRPPRATRR